MDPSLTLRVGILFYVSCLSRHDSKSRRWLLLLCDCGLKRQSLLASGSGTNLGNRSVRINQEFVSLVLFLSASLAPAADRCACSAEPEFPAELVNFEPSSKNPVFTARGEGYWDARIRERGWILREGDKYHMWFTGYDGTRQGLKLLGYASSQDGLKWTRHPNNPIYRDHWVEDMMVVKQGDVFYMFAEGRGDRAHLLTSKDGIHWTRQGQLDVRRTNGEAIESGPYGTPTAWFENDVWYFFYERRDLGIWLATSKDMRQWTNVQDDPVLRPGPGKHERDFIALNQIVKYQGRYYAYYHGAAKGTARTLWTTNVAVSTDLRHWKKYSGNPLLPVEDNKSSGILVRDGNRFRLYTMHDEVHVHFSPKKF